MATRGSLPATLRARVFHTEDFALSWSTADTPVAGGEGAGLTSISMADGRVGTVFGGNLDSRDAGMDSAARTTDGGGSWTPLPALSLPVPVYGGAHVPGTGGQALIAVGPGGVDVSVDGGQHLGYSRLPVVVGCGIGWCGRQLDRGTGRARRAHPAALSDTPALPSGADGR